MTINFKAGFSVQQTDETGRIEFPEVIGDEIEIPLFDNAVQMLASGISTVALVMMLAWFDNLNPIEISSEYGEEV